MNKLLIKLKSSSPAAKASLATLFSNLVLKGLSLISGPIFTRIMSTEQYGIVVTFLSWESMLSVIITLNLSSGVFNNGMLEFRENREEFQLSILTVSSISTLLYFVVFLLFRDYLIDAIGLDLRFIYILFLYFLVTPAYWYWSGKQRYEFKYKLISLITILSAVVSLVLGIVLVLNAPDGQTALYRIISFDGINILIGAVFFVVLIVKASFRINLSYCKYALKFNLPLIPHYMSMYVLSSSDRIMITRMINNSATAIYSVASTIGSVITILWQSIEASLSPWIYQQLEGNQKEVKKVTAQIMCIFAALSVGCTLFAPEIMAILAPKSYIAGIYVIPSIAAGVCFTAMYSLYMRIELFYKQNRFAAIASLIAAVSNIILNWIFIKLIGAVAAGYTTMVCYALLALLHYINVKIKGYSDCINNRLFLIISIIMIIVTLVITMLYSFTLIRYTVIVCSFIIMFFFKNRLLKIVKIVKGGE